MKLLFITFFFIIFCINTYAKTFSMHIENDGIYTGHDKHYTNGVFFSYLSNKQENKINLPTLHKPTKYQSLGLSYSNLAFTPANIKSKEKIKNEIPYAAINLFDFILYNWDDIFFHEYILTLGMVGKSGKTKQMQETFHNTFGFNEPKGWDNQLSDDFLYNITYSYAQNIYKKKFDYGKLDIINNIRINLGNYHRGILLGSMLRYGNNYPNNFNTVGRYLGVNENKLLNLDSKTNKHFAWSLSYGLIYSFTDFYYVNDFNKFYNNEKIRDTITQVISYDTYFDKFIFSISYKSSDLSFNKNKKLQQTWGGFSFSYLF